MNRVVRPFVVSVLAAACLLSVATPAQSTGVTVFFEVSLGGHTPTGVPYAACDVSVPDGANGLAVMDAVVASGCISSYDTVYYSGFGSFVTCVDEICYLGEGLITYWHLFFDEASASVGIEGFEASEGRRLELAYTSHNCWLAGAC